MRTVLNGPLPKEVDDFLARRRALGHDTFDEVWNGEYHINPGPNARHGRAAFRLAEVLGPLIERAGLHPITGFNIGVIDNYRVPDLGALRTPSDETWVDDAAIVVEVLSPDDESRQKFDHFATYGVDEVFIVDPSFGTVEIYVRRSDGVTFEQVERSALLGISADEVAARLD